MFHFILNFTKGKNINKTGNLLNGKHPIFIFVAVAGATGSKMGRPGVTNINFLGPFHQKEAGGFDFAEIFVSNVRMF